MAVTEHDRNHPFTYTVNGEERSTTNDRQTMGAVVEGAGFAPAADYELADDNTERQYTDPAEEVHLHQGQSFTVTYKGVTQTS